jgi:hypothetical protein
MVNRERHPNVSYENTFDCIVMHCHALSCTICLLKASDNLRLEYELVMCMSNIPQTKKDDKASTKASTNSVCTMVCGKNVGNKKLSI